MSIATTPDAGSAPHLTAVPPIDDEILDVADLGDVFEDDGGLTPAPITGAVGQRYTVPAINLDERYIGHMIVGRSIVGQDFSGALRSIHRHQLEHRIVVVVGADEHHLLYRDLVLIVVVRSMPMDPRQRELNKLNNPTR